MNLDDTKKRVQKYLNSNKRYPLIVDVQTREDLANIAEYFKVGSNKFPAIEEFCNQDEAIKLDELYASVSSNSGNTFITGLKDKTYDDVKYAWKKLYDGIKESDQIVQNNEIKANSGLDLKTDKLSQYQTAFQKYVNQLGEE